LGKKKNIRKRNDFYCEFKPTKEELSKGEKYFHGYRFLYMPDFQWTLRNGWVAEHRYVIMKKLGRRLRSTEHVHHINKNKYDNSVGNLIVLDDFEHNIFHCKKNISKKNLGKAMKYIRAGVNMKINEIKTTREHRVESFLKNNPDYKPQEKQAFSTLAGYSESYKIEPQMSPGPVMGRYVHKVGRQRMITGHP